LGIHKEVLDSLLPITKTTTSAPLPLPFSQIIFGQDHTFHMNFTLRGILGFQVKQLKGTPVRITKPLYMFFSDKFMLAVQMKESLCSLRRIVRILPTRLNHLSQFSPAKALLKETFKGVVLSTWATVTFFFLTIL
jgi:hypothetical protein